MFSPIFNERDTLVMLNAYAPHDIDVEVLDVDTIPHRLKLVGCDFKATMGLLDSKHGVRPHSPHVFRPVLYSLADLPHLSEEGNTWASPVQAVINALGFIQRGDYGSGEWPTEITVKAASDETLHLVFSTSYAPEPSRAEREDDQEEEYNPEDYVGADYELLLNSQGSAQWRNVTANQRTEESAGKHCWHIVDGLSLHEAFEYLRTLHVAVGRMAYVKQHWSNATRSYTPQYSYVRKQLPPQSEV